MLKKTLTTTFVIALVIVLAVPAAITREAGKAGSIPVDCLDHDQPQLCARVVEEVITELHRFNEAFNPPDLDRLSAFFHEDAIVFSRGRFFIGREEIRNDLLTPLVAGITGATVDVSALRFQVISPNLVIAYGSPRTVITLPGGASVTLPPLTQSHTWIRQSVNGERRFVLLTDHNGGSETGSGDAGLAAVAQTNASGDIHPDCENHHEPRLCNHVVEQLSAELDRFNDAFISLDVNELAAFFHKDAILFVNSTGRFFRGRDEIRNDFFVPLVSDIVGATVDISAFHYRVIGPGLVVLFGSPTTVVTFSDGATVTLPPLPQTLTWARQGADRTRPFVILTDHE